VRGVHLQCPPLCSVGSHEHTTNSQCGMYVIFEQLLYIFVPSNVGMGDSRMIISICCPENRSCMVADSSSTGHLSPMHELRDCYDTLQLFS
jgi:hypothetical protein